MVSSSITKNSIIIKIVYLENEIMFIFKAVRKKNKILQFKSNEKIRRFLCVFRLDRIFVFRSNDRLIDRLTYRQTKLYWT